MFDINARHTAVDQTGHKQDVHADDSVLRTSLFTTALNVPHPIYNISLTVEVFCFNSAVAQCEDVLH